MDMTSIALKKNKKRVDYVLGTVVKGGIREIKTGILLNMKYDCM